MTLRAATRVGCAGLVLLVASAVVEAGNWVVITVKNLPDHIVVGTPVTLTYAVRQHGMHLLGGLHGQLEMRAGADVVRAATTAAPEVGYYSATFTLPRPGAWTIDVVSGFGGGIDRSRIMIQAIEAAGQAPALSEAERGQRLFTGKGCITCHVHGAANGHSASIAQELTSKRYQPEYLKRLLGNPPPPRPGQPDEVWGMPNLGLRDSEIASLVAFLNAR
jgi:hypothetical protein